MAHKHGGDIYSYSNIRDFSANINFRGMPEKVREAAVRAIDESVHYPDPDCRTLRTALAERERVLYGRPGILPEHILCGNGAAELLFALVGACRPAHAFLAVPSFFEYEEALEAFGCRISRYRLKPEQDFALSKECLEAMTLFAGNASAGDMVILGNPNNPTGRLIGKEILQDLICLCRDRHLLLVLDESFFDFLSACDRDHTFSGVCGIPDNPGIFVIRSFTKIYALPGIRFGYGLCSDRVLLGKMRKLLQPWNVSLVAQEAAKAAASEYEFAENSAEKTAANRKRMADALRNAGYQVFPSNANFLLFCGPRDLQDSCLERGFLIRDCSNFPGLESAAKDRAYFRICVRSEEENEAILRVLGGVYGESDYDTGYDVQCR